MFSQDAAPWRQPILDQVVVELYHGRHCSLDLPLKYEEAGEFKREKDHLNDDSDHP